MNSGSVHVLYFQPIIGSGVSDMKATADRLKGNNKVILVHGNADMDAIGSAYALAKCFPTADIYAPNGVDRVAKMVSEKMGIEILTECDIEKYDLVVAVDTSSPEQLGAEAVKIPQNSVIIDHHQRNDKWQGMHFYCDDAKVACAEIILDLIRECDIELTRDVGLVLLGGMLTDSGHFQFANPTMLRNFAYVLEKTGLQMDEALALTKSEVNMSERVSVMKCIERSRFDRVGDMIVAISYGGSYEASGCRALMLAGADVVFVASQRDESFRLSARATQEMVRRGINLGDIVKDIGSETTTDGGGHEGAAGLSGIGDIEAMLHICMQRTMDEFRKIKKSREALNESPSE